MESLLSMYRSDDEGEDREGGARARDSDDSDGFSSSSSSSSSSSAPGARATTVRSKKRPSDAGGNAGSAGRKRRLATASAAASALALPGLDDDFFAVSPDHVYTTVLTNGQRVVKPSAPTRFARAVPHIEGNWATHIYIRVPNTEEVLQLAHACIAHGHARLGARVLAEGDQKEEGEDHENKDEDGTPLIVPGDLKPAEAGGAQHLSLSRTAYLRSHHIDPFVADLNKSLAWATSFTVGLDPAFGLLVNDERTRSFLTIGVASGCEERLRRLVASVDEVLGQYKQATYYENPRFHVSVGSLQGDVEAKWTEGKGTNEGGEGGAAVVVDVVEVRIGRKLFTIGLREL